MSQTTVDYQGLPFPGVLTSFAPRKIDSFLNAEATAEIPFGVLVCAGTGERDAKVTTSTGKPLGVVAHSHHYGRAHGDYPGELGTVGLLPTTTMNVLSMGEIYVLLNDDVSAGDTVYVRHTAVTGKKVGGFGDVEAGKTATLSGAKFMTGGKAGSVAVLWIDALGATLTANT